MTAALQQQRHHTAPHMDHLHNRPLHDDVIFDMGDDDDDDDVGVRVIEDDLLVVMTPRDTPIPGQESEPPYRCPVSTPANFIRPSPRVRRTKPMPVSLEICLTPKSTNKRSAGGRPPPPHRPGGNHQLPRVGGGGGGGSNNSNSLHGKGMGVGVLGDGFGVGVGGSGSSGGGSIGGRGRGGGFGGGVVGVNSRSLNYYYVDRAEERREAAETNTFWLRALCSQPVGEILDKYKRRSDFRRSRLLWSKTYTTPGERSLLKAWERNGPSMFSPATYPPLLHQAQGGLPRNADPLHPHNHTAHRTRSFQGGGGGARSRKGSSSGSGMSPSGMARRIQSEPPDRSRGYPSEPGYDDDDGDVSDDDDAEDADRDAVHGGGESSSAADADVSFASHSSPSQPRSRLPPSHIHSSSSPSGSSSYGTRGGWQEAQEEAEGAQQGGAHQPYPAEPAYHMSDHFQISLPSVGVGVQGGQQQRGRWEERRGEEGGMSSPTSRRPLSLTRSSLRPRPLGGLVASQLSEAPSGSGPSPRGRIGSGSTTARTTTTTTADNSARTPRSAGPGPRTVHQQQLSSSCAPSSTTLPRIRLL